ncbi:MAG: DUF4124 domain-containing protein [Nevskiales bacterium]
MRTTPGMGLVGLAVASLLFCAVAGADTTTLYRWVDKDGHVHYGDQAAPNAKPVNPKVPGSEDAQDAADAAAKAATDKQAADCKGKNDELARYRSATSITETDALGNSKDYTAEQRDQLVAKTQKYVDDHCGCTTPGG